MRAVRHSTLHYIVVIIIFFYLDLVLTEETKNIKNVASQQRRCSYKIRKLWQTDISSFPFAASPLVTDIDGDGGLDIIAAPFGETLAVIEGETGKYLHDTSWPQHNLDKSVHSSALQFDIDGDGILDLLFVTSQGEGLFYTSFGHALPKYTFQLPAPYVHSSWFRDSHTVPYQNLHNYVFFTEKPGYIPVDPHVLSTPVLYNMSHLIFPVSCFYSNDDYNTTDGRGPWGERKFKNNFFLAAVAVLDLNAFMMFVGHGRNKDGQQEVSFIKMFFLELSESPVFNLFTPTVIDIDGNFGPPEIITGLSSGQLYVLSLEGSHRAGFPLTFANISGRVSAADLNDDGDLELVVLDTKGTAHCLSSKTAQLMWSTEIGGTSFAGSAVTNIDYDNYLDVVVATDQGKVFALSGVNGTILPHYPFKAGRRIVGHVLVTKFNVIKNANDLVFLSDDGILHILAADHSCLSQMALADSSFVDIMTYNVVGMNRGMELIVSTSDGSLICLGSGMESSLEERVDLEYSILSKRLAYPSDTATHNNFYFSLLKPVILIDESTKLLKEVTGSFLEFTVNIFNSLPSQKFHLKVYLGSHLVHTVDQVSGDNSPLSINIRTPEQPGQAHIVVAVYNQFGFVYTDSIFLKFNQLILLDLQWLVLAPFIAMIIILLVNHGFPAKDLLPITFPSKSK
ncbi:protein DEFECTIVE IN EXINE FORMATION 1 [Biomphalaria pfeifferi]|uniref:Protein DEFECTIVE IN EXINE FORMATION 1 n=1 Tax=Biomphalaria pfeifferi TaxID=112525 RepID=A0AAD8F723_BIOPF|nr:protein DEFECTIVE IN EXINE FORMATION 1 [Biomphalaria pfeifferi]